MKTRTVFLLWVTAVAAVACSDTSPATSTWQKQVRGLTDEVRAERQRLGKLQQGSIVQGAAPASALDMATALDVPAGLVSRAELTSPDSKATLIERGFGVIKPKQGPSLVVMSTGRIKDERLPEPGTDFLPEGPENDAVVLRITINVPHGSTRMSFNYNFLSAESPEYVGSEYNDIFAAYVEDRLGRKEVGSASVNSSFFFDVSKTRADRTGFELLFADDPSEPDEFPGNYPVGTLLFPDAGITDFKSVNFEVAGGGPVTLEFRIQDRGDGYLDSTVVLDNIAFSGLEVVDPNPTLINPFDGSVMREHDKLARGDKLVQGVVADGVTQVLLRASVPGPGRVQFTLPGSAAEARVNGAVGTPGAPSWSNTVTVDAVQVSGRYHAFALYRGPDDFSTGAADAQVKVRSINMDVQYAQAGEPGFRFAHQIKIHRPTVLLLHDIWSSCQLLNAHFKIESEAFESYCADYKDTNWAGLESNKNVIPKALFTILEKVREQGVAVTQVDVVAHGMGGLLARRFVDQPNYYRTSNFNAGDFNRLITMNTPHAGSRMADEIVIMRDYLKKNNIKQWESHRDTLVKQGIYVDNKEDGSNNGVAIDDLRLKSAAIMSIGETKVPSHMLVMRGGLDIVRDDAIGMLSVTGSLYMQLERTSPNSGAPAVKKTFIFPGCPQDFPNCSVGDGKWLKSRVFCDDENDFFVTKEEQEGGVGLSGISYFRMVSKTQDTEHFKTPHSNNYIEKVTTLLNNPIQGGAFVSSIPSPRGVSPKNSCNGQSIAAAGLDEWHRTGSSVSSQGAMRIVSPTPGTSVSPGQSVAVVLEPSGGFVPETLFIIVAGEVAILEQSQYTLDLTIPAHAMGAVELFVSALNAEGEMVVAPPVALSVTSASKLDIIEILNGDVYLRSPGATHQLVVSGHYKDEVFRDISSPGTGTVYSSSNPKIATVTSHGLVTGVSPGIATVTIRNGTIFTSISVVVKEERVEQCTQVRLGDYNLFVLEDYSQGHDIQGRVAAGGSIALRDFSVGRLLPDVSDTTALVSGGNMTLASGDVWGNAWYGSQLVADHTVNFARGKASPGSPINFAAIGGRLRVLTSELAALPANGTTTLTPWGGILLRGTAQKINVFSVDGSAFTGARRLQLEAPAQSLAIINVRGTSATLSGMGEELSGGVEGHGVLFNLPEVTSLTASDIGLVGTVLAPYAHVTFNRGGWEGGIYARSLTGNAAGSLKPLKDIDICR